MLPSILKFASPSTRFLILIKPQFEIKKDELPPGGVLKNQSKIDEICNKYVLRIKQLGFSSVQLLPSRLPGTKGNKEYFIAIEQ